MKTFKQLIESLKSEKEKLKKERVLGRHTMVDYHRGSFVDKLMYEVFKNSEKTYRKCKKCAFFEAKTGMCLGSHRLPKDQTKWRDYEESVVLGAFYRYGADMCAFFTTKKDKKACETREKNLEKMERGCNERYKLLEKEEQTRLQEEKRKSEEEANRQRVIAEETERKLKKEERDRIVATGMARCQDCAYFGKISRREYKKDFSFFKDHFCCYFEKDVRINDKLEPCEKFSLIAMLTSEEKENLSRRMAAIIEIEKANSGKIREKENRLICGGCAYFDTVTEKVYINGEANKKEFSYCYATDEGKSCDGRTSCHKFLAKNTVSRSFEESLAMKRAVAERKRAEKRENEEIERRNKEEAERRERERKEAEEKARKTEEERRRKNLEAEEKRIKEEKRREYLSHLIPLDKCKKCIYFKEGGYFPGHHGIDKDRCEKTGVMLDLETSRYDCKSFKMPEVKASFSQYKTTQSGKCKDCFHVYTDEQGYYCFHRTCSLDYVNPNWGCPKFESKRTSYEANYGTRTSTNGNCRNCRHVLTDDDGWYCFHMTCREERVSPDKGCDKFESKF